MVSLIPTAFGLLVASLATDQQTPAVRREDKYFFRTIHVTPDGRGDGRRWEQATSLQRLVDGAEDEAAILNRKGTVPCEQLWLSRGEHHLSKRLFANKDFHVSILGGFAGTETSAEQRDPEVNRTTIVLKGCQLLFTRWADHLTVDGLTIRNGQAEQGGAIHVAGSRGGGNSILIHNVDFVRCTASRSGGAIRVHQASRGSETRNLRIVDCRFIDCSAGTAGGAVMIDKRSPDDFDGVLVRGCEFRGNRCRSDQSGGAIFVDAPNLRVRPVCLEYCLFDDNQCETATGSDLSSKGAAVRASAAQLVVKHCQFVGSSTDLLVQGPGKHELKDNRFISRRRDVTGILSESDREPAWDGHSDPSDWCYRDMLVSAAERSRGKLPGAQYALYQPSISYSMICEGQTPPLFGKYQHGAALAHFDGKFFVVWQLNPTVYIEWGRGRKIYFSTSVDFETWSTPQLLAPDLVHRGGTQPLLLSAPNGELWCLWLAGGKDPQDTGLWLSTRRPGVEKWTHRRVFSEERFDQEYTLYPQSNPWVLSSGRIIAPFIARVGDSREPRGVFLYTDDDGISWQLSDWIRWPVNERNLGIWEIHGSEQQDGRIRVFSRNLAYDPARPDTVFLTTCGTGAALTFPEEVKYAGVQGSQNRPQVIKLRGSRYCLFMPDTYARSLPCRTASLYFSRSGTNDYVAGPALVPSGVCCSYPQGIEHEGSLYIAATGEYPDDWRNMVGIKVSPSPEPDQFYLWPRHRELAPYVFSEPPGLTDLQGRACVQFRDTGSAGVDIMPLDLAAGDRLELRFDVKVQSVPPEGQCVLFSFGDTTPIRIGGPSLANGRLSVSTGKQWREVVDFPLGSWHSLVVEITAAKLSIAIDSQQPRSFAASAAELNPRLYLGEGVIVGDFNPSRGFQFVVDLPSLRTAVYR